MRSRGYPSAGIDVMHDPRVQRWLSLEEAAGEGGPGQVFAEAALVRLFQLLPEYAPGSGLEAAVLTRIRRAPSLVARWRRRLGPWGLRAAAVWSVVQVGIVVALWLSVVRGLSLSLGPVRLLALLSSMVARGLDWVADALPVVFGVAEVFQSLSSTGPVVPVVLFVCVVASAAGFLLVASHLNRTGEAIGAMR